MQIVIDLPESQMLDDSAETLGQRIKLYAALMMFRAGQISAGSACELAGIDRYAFLTACREHRIPVVSYPEDELEMEVEWLQQGGFVSS